jgi:hypothetical protein
MTSDLLGRLSVALLILALVIGPAGSSMRMLSMTGQMATVALSGADAVGPHADCGGSKSGVPIGACSVHCAGMMAISPLLSLIDDVAPATQEYHKHQILIGQRARPDPYPPRSIVLS